MCGWSIGSDVADRYRCTVKRYLPHAMTIVLMYTKHVQTLIPASTRSTPLAPESLKPIPVNLHFARASAPSKPCDCVETPSMMPRNLLKTREPSEILGTVGNSATCPDQDGLVRRSPGRLVLANDWRPRLRVYPSLDVLIGLCVDSLYRCMGSRYGWISVFPST